MDNVINLNKYRYERELVIDEFIEQAEAQIRHLNYLIEGFKDLKKRITNFLDKAYKGKDRDPYLKKQEFKVRTGEALEKAI